jgi:hypothetical protein
MLECCLCLNELMPGIRAKCMRDVLDLGVDAHVLGITTESSTICVFVTLQSPTLLSIYYRLASENMLLDTDRRVMGHNKVEDGANGRVHFMNPQPPSLKLEDQLCAVLRLKHDSLKTEES